MTVQRSQSTQLAALLASRPSQPRSDLAEARLTAMRAQLDLLRKERPAYPEHKRSLEQSIGTLVALLHAPFVSTCTWRCGGCQGERGLPPALKLSSPAVCAGMVQSTVVTTVKLYHAILTKLGHREKVRLRLCSAAFAMITADIIPV